MNIMNEPEDPSDPEDKPEDDQSHLAGIIARACEEAGLVQRTDEFSWEWHMEFDPLMQEHAETQSEAQAEVSCLS